MDNSTDKGDQEKESSPELDLSGLQDFNFAANWSESSTAPARRERDSGPRRGERRERHSDRRPDRRPGRDRPRRPEGEGDAGRPAARRSERTERPRRKEERPEVALLRDSPFDIQIFPEEPILATLIRAMRHSLRTYELFEIARLIVEKPDRFHVSLRFKDRPDDTRSLYQSEPDGLPFATEEAAVDHVIRSHLDSFFTVEEVETEPPKGSFQFIARCTLNGDFLTPPNYHRYQSILLQYYQERFSDMPFERFRSHIETVKDDEAIARWLESMKKQRRYTLLGAPEGEAPVFESPEDARSYLLQHKKDKVVRVVKSVRFPGKLIEKLSDQAIRPYVVAYTERQKRFPLDTANTMRGRLRRQHFFIYKKGSRGISLVCAVKRKFRQPNQVFSETIQSLITFLEQNDEVHASQLPEKFLGIAAPAEGEGTEPATPDPAVEEKLKRLNLDLRWLLSEGYVTEYSDGRLSVHPVLAPGRAGRDEERAKKGRKAGSGEAEPDKGDEPEAHPAEEKSGQAGAASEEAAVSVDSEAEETKEASTEPEPASDESKADAPSPEEEPKADAGKSGEEISPAASGTRQQENS